MDTRIYDPFGWRLDELADPDIDATRRSDLLTEFLIAEAEELAMGRRHLTIIHGEPGDVAEAEYLNDFYDAVADIIEPAEWCRLTGGRDHLTVTVAGRRRDEILATVADHALQSEHHPGWTVLDGPALIA
ncbi:MAG: hypothetical protein CL424_14695 [Acidimicrobiaceae bacterium]|nr:hypothetical protein [Acidimicrobiaceae bacterium]